MDLFLLTSVHSQFYQNETMKFIIFKSIAIMILFERSLEHWEPLCSFELHLWTHQVSPKSANRKGTHFCALLWTQHSAWVDQKRLWMFSGNLIGTCLGSVCPSAAIFSLLTQTEMAMYELIIALCSPGYRLQHATWVCREILGQLKGGLRLQCRLIIGCAVAHWSVNGYPN